MSFNKLFQVRPDQFRGIVKRNAVLMSSTTTPITTLALKNSIRHQYPHMYVDQNMVSTAMDYLCQLGTFNYIDNGTYREYYLNSSGEAAPQNLSKKTYNDPGIFSTSFDVKTGLVTEGLTPAQLNMACSYIYGLYIRIPENVHYSTTKGTYEYLEDVQINHLENIIKKGKYNLLVTRFNEVEEMLKDKYFKEYLRRNGWQLSQVDQS